MTTRDFCYWLQGYFEMENPQELDTRKTSVIKQHLALVFDKKTPVEFSPFSQEMYVDGVHPDYDPSKIAYCGNVGTLDNPNYITC